MSKTLDQLVGQLIIAGFRSDKVSNNSNIVRYIKEYNLSGVILYDQDIEKNKLGSRNIKSPAQLKMLTDNLQSISDNPLFISIDQEGGNVNRLNSSYGFPEFPSWQHIGLLDNDLITKQFAESMSETMTSTGINLNFAPVLDLDYGEKTYIGKLERAFSGDPKLVIEHSKIFIDTMKNDNIISCGKHFPGQGSAKGDTHNGFIDISESWSVADLLPYTELIESHHLDMIMLSHVFNNKFDPEFPASLSHETITNSLRNDLNFKGVIICDDPSMRAISDNYDFEDMFVLMINSGIDLLCLGNNLNYDPDFIPKAVRAIRSAIEKNRISTERINESIDRIASLKKKYNLYE
jgi:beta-N-acetylhexosaminidase